jgi:pimeloyl-ACP methyl ester carboxylesterase
MAMKISELIIHKCHPNAALSLRLPTVGGILFSAFVCFMASALPIVAVGQQPPAVPGVKPGQPAANPPRPNFPNAGQRPAQPPAVRPGAKKPERPAPKTLSLMTADGVMLRTMYFPSDKGKEAVPVILIHEWQGQASPYGGLVKALWDAGCAVVVPELRGHGGSKEQEVAGRKREFDVSRMGKADVMSMITGDLEAVKKFLVEENNAQRLNLNALTLVGVREGAILASHWAVRDLNFPSVGALKQGQDVKAMVLISPERVIKGVGLDDTINDRIFVQLPFQIVIGKTSRQASETDRFHKKLEGLKKRMARGDAKDLQYVELPTSLDGPALLNDVPGVIEKVKTFIDTTMIANAGRIPWVARQ